MGQKRLLEEVLEGNVIVSEEEEEREEEESEENNETCEETEEMHICLGVAEQWGESEQLRGPVAGAKSGGRAGGAKGGGLELEAGPSPGKRGETWARPAKAGCGQRLGELVDSTHKGTPYKEIPPDIIMETQMTCRENNINEVYREMLIEIGLDSPSPSHERRRNNEGNITPKWGQTDTGVSSPVRSSAASLMALGQHALTPRQRRLWEERGKSPLGNKGIGV